MSTSYTEYAYANGEKNHIHSYLMPKLLPLVGRDVNKTILDVGCGNGWLAEVLHQRGFEVYGIDASQSGIKIANQRIPGRFFVQDLSKDELPDPLKAIPFDTIISTEVIEHLYNPRGYISFCKGILARNGGGELIISTPYHGYFKNIVLALSGKMDAHFTVLWDGGHIKFWSKATITVLLEEAGFKVKLFKGAGRLPYLWKSMIIKAQLVC